ncbi:unnamed protein product [Acanthocheilonema viteae]|uniref:Uncharacterized protein n=1 Tax=Acanthocheilonema viteae TaxID=6277 RepID=A0A498ST76_ACAVI|nr:unnamed protein product [Acanthocheilonema viteae]
MCVQEDRPHIWQGKSLECRALKGMFAWLDGRNRLMYVMFLAQSGEKLSPSLNGNCPTPAILRMTALKLGYCLPYLDLSDVVFRSFTSTSAPSVPKKTPNNFSALAPLRLTTTRSNFLRTGV